MYESRGYMGNLYLPLNFIVNLKLLKKKKKSFLKVEKIKTWHITGHNWLFSRSFLIFFFPFLNW